MGQHGKITAKRRTQSNAPEKSKKDRILAQLRRKSGASLQDLAAVSGWQDHSIRGFLSGTVKKKLGYSLITEKPNRGPQRYYIREAK
ncbi:DUF3489 domain-containing protein [Hyphococcus sp. DH-69]|uniref:DUF3489 domain-containing protein n=1 Tax=Hyphococcus formosus TaxID=3143534 RepID=UPI00398B73FF